MYDIGRDSMELFGNFSGVCFYCVTVHIGVVVAPLVGLQTFFIVLGLVGLSPA